jgi:hypothetical protein
MSRVTHIRRPSRRAVHLTGRDLQLMQVLAERRVETLDDYLGPNVFAGVSRKRGLNRLGELISAGFLSRTSLVLTESERERSVYMLTARGHRQAIEAWLSALER